MSQFLSREWLDELGTVAATDPALREAARGVRLTVRHVVGDVSYRVCFDDGTVAVVAGGEGEADVEIRQDRVTAAALSRGELTPAQAFAAGRLTLAGRHGLLAQHREAFARLNDVFAGLRATTTY